MAIINFNAAQVQPDAGRMGPVPAGWYNFVVSKSEVVPGKNDPINSARLNINCDVVDGEYKGRVCFHGFNIKNPSAKAMEISFAQLSALAHAVGVLMVQDSSQLHNIPFKGKVKITIDPTGQYEPKNEFTAFKNVNDTTAVNTPGTAATNPAMAPVRPAAPPMAAPGGWAPQQSAQPTPVQQMQPPAQQAPMQMAPPQQAAPQWQAPEAAQPWSNPAQAPATESVQAAPVQVAAQPEPAAAAPVVAAGQTPPPWMAQTAA